MVKGAEGRVERWTKKLSGDARKRAYDSQKTGMVRQEAVATKDLVKIEEEIKNMIQGEPVYLQHFYMAFAKQIYKLKNKFSDLTLINELMILEEIWRARGLSADLLDKIKIYYITPYTNIYELFCRFDIGRFDINTFG